MSKNPFHFSFDFDFEEIKENNKKKKTIEKKYDCKCECGAWITKNTNCHSYWCPEYSKYKK